VWDTTCDGETDQFTEVPRQCSLARLEKVGWRGSKTLRSEDGRDEKWGKERSWARSHCTQLSTIRRYSPNRALASSFFRFRNLEALDRTALDKWSRRKGLYLHRTTQHRRQRPFPMSRKGIRTSYLTAKTYALDCGHRGQALYSIRTTNSGNKHWEGGTRCNFDVSTEEATIGRNSDVNIWSAAWEACSGYNVEYGYQVSTCCSTKQNHGKPCSFSRSQELPDAYWLLAGSPVFKLVSRNCSLHLCCCFIY
jgi:hypothetical protein